MKKKILCLIIIALVALSAFSCKGVTGSEDPAKTVTEWVDLAMKYALESDYENFKSLFFPTIDTDIILERFQFFRALEGFDKKEITVEFTTDYTIGAEVFLYVQPKEDNTAAFQYKTMYVPLEIYGSKWYYSVSADMASAYEKYLIPTFKERYGEEYVAKNNCFYSKNYELIYNKVIRNDLAVHCMKCMVNSDGTVTVTFAFVNGGKYSVFDLAFTDDSYLYDNGGRVYDLRKLGTINKVVSMGAITTYTVTINKADCIIPPDEWDLSQMSVKCNFKYNY
ncbi:MAG: hypothetical protein GX061_04925 [Eubacteriaceae bacterium]|nr:hypothetical protein [Eubacteriaceae bacterium]